MYHNCLRVYIGEGQEMIRTSAVLNKSQLPDRCKTLSVSFKAILVRVQRLGQSEQELAL
jgi:hypothetical protein